MNCLRCRKETTDSICGACLKYTRSMLTMGAVTSVFIAGLFWWETRSIAGSLVSAVVWLAGIAALMSSTEK